MNASQYFRLFAIVGMTFAAGCDVNIGDLIDDVDDVLEPNDASLTNYATNTGGASGLAFRPSDGAMFIVNQEGLFGPINEGDDVSTMTPLGATNLADPALFDQEQPGFTLAITNDGEFWIGSSCCSTLGIVPPEGGDAEPFTDLLDGIDAANIQTETLALVPDGFEGDQIQPGQILVGADTSFSALAAVDPSDRSIIQMIDNDADEETNRDAHHLTFGLDGNLYSSRASSALTAPGIQQIDSGGTPEGLTGTEGTAANTFVGLANGDLLLNGTFREQGEFSILTFNGLYFFNADSESISRALTLENQDNTEHDEMVIGPDGTIYMTLPASNRVVIVEDRR